MRAVLLLNIIFLLKYPGPLYRDPDRDRSTGLVMGVTLYTFEVPLGTPMKKVGTSGTPMLEALLKV